MTSDERDFDRIAQAWLDLGPNEAPDRSIASVLQAVETMPQVRRRLGWPIWRPTSMTRLPVLAVLAGLIVILIGAVALSSGNAPAPTPSQVPAAVGSAAPSDASASDPAATSTPGPIPPEIIGTWISELRILPGVEQAATTMIMFNDSRADPQAPGYSQEAAYSIPRDQSTVNAIGPDIIRIVANGPDAGAPTRCARGDVGLYRWSIPADGWLTLELVQDHPVLAGIEITTEEACSDRASILPGTWQRTTSRGGDGGPTVVGAFTPFMSVDLPPGAYAGDGNSYPDQAFIRRTDDSFVFSAWKDPDGFVDPCDRYKGRIDLEPGVDPFVTYLTSESGLQVTGSEEMEIDGHRAVRLDLSTAAGLELPCWSDGSVLMWTPHASHSIGEASMPLGESTTVIVTDVDGTTIVLEVLDLPTGSEASTPSVPSDVVDSIRFLDALPTPPGS